MSFAQNLNADIQRYGVGEALLGKLLKRLRRWFTIFRITTRPLGDENHEVSLVDRECRILTAEEARSLPAQLPDQVSVQFVEEALERGDICLATLVEDRIVGFIWRSYSTAPHTDNLWVRFKAPYRYGYKLYVLPEYRGKRIFDDSASDHYCLAQGMTHTVGFVERHNLASLRRQDRAQRHTTHGHVFMLRLFGKRWLLHTPGVKALGFEFYERETEESPATALA